MVGGVCGDNQATIINCYNTGSVFGYDIVGGVCGYNYEYTTISNCYNRGSVSGNQYVGGVCRVNYATITNCYNIGYVSGNKYLGGVCGASYFAIITNCYNTGYVSGNKYLGGVCGYNGENAAIINCYNNIDFCSLQAIGVNYEEAAVENVENITTYQLCNLDIEGYEKGSVSEENGVIKFKFPKCNKVGAGYVLNGSFNILADNRTYYKNETFTKDDIKTLEYKIGDITLSDKDDLIFSNDNNLKTSNIIKGEYHDYPFAITLSDVKDVELVSIELVENSFPATIIEGEELDLSKAQLKLTYDNGHNAAPEAVTKTMISGFDNTKVGKQEITITYEGVSTKFTIEVLKNPQGGDTPTATNKIATQTPTKVWSFDHTIYINVETLGDEVRIVDLNGRLIKTERHENTNNTITLNKEGIVIVKIEGKSWEVGLSSE